MSRTGVPVEPLAECRSGDTATTANEPGIFTPMVELDPLQFLSDLGLYGGDCNINALQLCPRITRAMRDYGNSWPLFTLHAYILSKRAMLANKRFVPAVLNITVTSWSSIPLSFTSRMTPSPNLW